MINIDIEIKNLVEYAVTNDLIDERDKIYAINRLLDTLGLYEYKEPICGQDSNRKLSSILDNIRQWAVINSRIEEASDELSDIFDTKIMNQLIKMPSEIEREFYDRYKQSPPEATDFFYRFSKNTNYIRADRIERDIKWKYETEYGTLDLTINMSKPEKDPKAIAKARESKALSYPNCLLCKENEGYGGRLNYPARSSHRIIGIKLAGERWFLQYSPYIYYNEHCIVLKEEHSPMKITKKTFQRLIEFIRMFPHYFIGSNADLPIVGGSILSHDHFQGGSCGFAMANAKEENQILLKNGIEACTLKWPMSVIRLKGKDADKLIETAYELFLGWKEYNDEGCLILSNSNGEEHNTVTPVCRYRSGSFEIDLVLRNNRTTMNNPYGIFHPREEYHHIKKENIGLIEVMGLAVLPSRLKKEMELLKVYVLNHDLEGIKNCEELKKHYSWSEMIMTKYHVTEKDMDEIIINEISEVFLGVLKDAGVFKDTEQGKMAFRKCRNVLFKSAV